MFDIVCLDCNKKKRLNYMKVNPEIKTDFLCILICVFHNQISIHHGIINQHSVLKHKNLVLLNNATNNRKPKKTQSC